MKLILPMKLRDLKTSGHWPTLLTAFLYFDFSFMVWTLLGALGVQIGEALQLNDGQRGLMVAVPILSGAILRLVLGLLVDRIGAKNTGIISQIIVMAGLAGGWLIGLSTFGSALVLGLILGVAGASFAVALPQAGRWYPPRMQGVVLGLAGAGNIGVVLDSLIAPRLAAVYGWQSVFGFALIPAILTFAAYVIWSKDAPGEVKRKKLSDYWRLLKEKDAHWFCFYYTISFGGFVGLASYYALFFKAEFGLPAVKAGDFAALCIFLGAVARPVGGAIADRVGRTTTTMVAMAISGSFAIVVGLACSQTDDGLRDTNSNSTAALVPSGAVALIDVTPAEADWMVADATPSLPVVAELLLSVPRVAANWITLPAASGAPPCVNLARTG